MRHKLTFFPNGNVGFESHFDTKLDSWMSVYLDYLESQGIDPANTDILVMIHGEWKTVTPFEVETNVWNWKIE